MEEEKKEEKKVIVEERTIEELLIDLRNQKDWTYLHVVEELNKLDIIVDEKKVKKWEIGLEYPDLDTIYKLSELYMIPSENFIMAKSNSYEKGMNSIHMTFIKWFCYITGISLKIAYWLMYAVLGISLIGALMFFTGKVEEFMEVRRAMK